MHWAGSSSVQQVQGNNRKDYRQMNSPSSGVHKRKSIHMFFFVLFQSQSQMLDEDGPEEDRVSVDGLPAYTRHGSEVSSPLSSRGELK